MPKKKTTATKKGQPKAATASGPGSFPRASRPIVPARYHFPTTEEGLLDWSWARERLEKSYNYVIVTVRPDGRPHAMGMHGLWIADSFYFGTGATTRKARNLESNRHCIVVNENLNELIIAEGVAEIVEPSDLPEVASAASKAKYGWPMGSSPGGLIFRVTPRVVFAFPLKNIATAVTRWVFD
jgi:hypothetical protein